VSRGPPSLSKDFFDRLDSTALTSQGC